MERVLLCGLFFSGVLLPGYPELCAGGQLHRLLPHQRLPRHRQQVAIFTTSMRGCVAVSGELQCRGCDVHHDSSQAHNSAAYSDRPWDPHPGLDMERWTPSCHPRSWRGRKGTLPTGQSSEAALRGLSMGISIFSKPMVTMRSYTSEAIMPGCGKVSFKGSTMSLPPSALARIAR